MSTTSGEVVGGQVEEDLQCQAETGKPKGTHQSFKKLFFFSFAPFWASILARICTPALHMPYFMYVLLVRDKE